MIPKKLLNIKNEVEHELTNNILPFWSIEMVDSENGGFYGRIDGTGKVYPKADKGCVMNARVLWTFSAAYRIFKKPEYLRIASRARDYVLNTFFDKQHKGVYWLVDYKGNMVDGKKQIYAQAFVIYALSEYYKISGDELSLMKAKELFHLIEKYSFDVTLDGYFEAFNREWGEIGDLRLSAKDANEKKTMNTHLHILEAYTNLYRVWNDDGLRNQLNHLVNLYADKFVNKQTWHLNMFFDEHWNDKSDLYSFGHDIESSWLLYEAAVVLNDSKLIQKIKELSVKIADASIEGYMPEGSFIYEKFFTTGHIDTDRHWWVNAEGVVGFFNAWELTGNQQYLDKSMAIWDFIKTNIIDSTNGEWFWSVDNNFKPNLKEDKAGFWKCPYHNARMCFEIMERVEKI
jgi:mannobiose 2-epimerase